MKNLLLYCLLAIVCTFGTAQNNAVVVYDNTNFTGEYRSLNNHWNPGGLDAFDNRIGSIVIPNGAWIIVFDEPGFRGHYLVIEKNWTATGDNSPWDNNISSILVFYDVNSGLPIPQQNFNNNNYNYNNYNNTANNYNNNNQYNYNQTQPQYNNSGIYYSMDAAIKNPENVIVLDVRGQNLSTWPSFFNNMKNLRELYISDNNFSSWPSFFSDLKQLRILEAQNNNLTSFPSFFGDLKNL